MLKQCLSEHFSAKSKATSGTLIISLTISEITTFLEKWQNLANLAKTKFVPIWPILKYAFPKSNQDE